MEKMKKMKIIAVDTSMGTNFLLLACEDTTMSELRGLIQKEHMSCFPEHESINVGALMVEYSKKQYHVTDPLLIGQVFRKRWNKIHAEVFSRPLRAASTSNSPKHIELESFVDGKTGSLGAALDDRPLAKRPEALQNAKSKNSGDDKQPLSDEAPAHGSSALLCRPKVLNNCIGMAPARMVSQDCLIDREKLRCPLLSIEAPYTQPCSELNAVTRAVLSKGALETKSKCRKRRCLEEDKILVRKRNLVEVDCQIVRRSESDRELNPDNITSSSSKVEVKEDEQKEDLERFHQYKQIQDCKNGFTEKAALTNSDERLANTYEEPNNDNPQQDTGDSDNSLSLDYCVANGSIVREPNTNSLPTNTEAFASNLGKMKLPEKHGSQTSDKRGTKGSPEMSARNQEEVLRMKEVYSNDGAQICQIDLSRGYPIQLNDHSILLVASLSADVVPETQESQMESRDGINPGGEEKVARTKGGLEALEPGAVEPHYGCLRDKNHPQLVDPVEPQVMEAPGLPFYQDARNMNTKELNNQLEDLEMLVDKEENSKLKPLEVTDRPSKSLSPEENNVIVEARKLGLRHCDHEKQVLDAYGGVCGGFDHNISLHRKKKKRRRRKVIELQKVLTEENGRLVDSDSEQQDVQGGVDPEKTMDEHAQLNKSLIGTFNGKPGTCNQEEEEESHELEAQAQIDRGSSDNVRFKDLGSSKNEIKKRKVSTRANASDCRKKQKHSVREGATRSSERGKCKESVSFSGKSVTEPKNISIESGEECMEGSSIGDHNTLEQEHSCTKEGVGEEFDTTYRKKVKQSKEPTTFLCDHRDDAGISNTPSNCESAPVDRFINKYNENEFRPPSIKELPNALGLLEEDERGNMNLNANADRDQVTVFHPNVDDTESLLKDGPVTSSSTGSSSKEGLVTTKQGFDVFEFESSETVNRQKENFIHTEATSNAKADNLDELCSVAVKFVEGDTLNPLTMTTRKTGRKSIHPRRWITVLSERLAWNQTSKSSSKKKRPNKRSRLSAKGTCPVEMPSNDDFNPEAYSLQKEDEKEGSSQVIVDDGRIACPAGCGRRYAKKTSAYYRHRQKCSA